MKLTFSLLLLSLSLNPLFAKEADTITIIVNPAQKNINFKTPQSMLYSFGASYTKKLLGEKLFNLHKGGMGHVVARVDCHDTRGEHHSFFAGLSGQYSTEQDKIDVFEDKLGLSLLFREYPDGYIQPSSYVKLLVGDHKGRVILDGKGKFKRMRPKFMSFEVTPQQCERAVDYYQTFKEKSFGEAPSREEYVTMAPNEPLYFSFNFDPAKTYESIKKNNLDIQSTKMGGGCSSFATGFLKVTGLFSDSFDKMWKVNLKVGESLMGDPNKNKEVKILTVAKARAWSKNGERTRSLSFYHPENIWSFFEGVEDCLAGRTKSRFCTPEVNNWAKKRAGKFKVHTQRIKYEKEMRAQEGQAPRVSNRVRELSGLLLKRSR